MLNINTTKTTKTTKENTEHTTINESNIQEQNAINNNKGMYLSNEISPNKPNTYRGYAINNSYNNTSSKFQLFSEAVITWETFARDDLLTFLELEAPPLMLFHLIQEMFHITHNLLKELINETLCSVRKALKLPPKEETIKNIENRVKPLFKENLDEIFCSKTENEKFRKKFDKEYTKFFMNEINLKYSEDDKSLDFYSMLNDQGFGICLSHVKHILLFCEFNEEQLCLSDIENHFNERQIEVINLTSKNMISKHTHTNNNHITSRPYLILNETQNCHKVIPVIHSPLIRKNKLIFNKEKFKTIVIPITEQQEECMKTYPLQRKDSIRMSTNIKNSFENEYTRSPEGKSVFTLNGQIENISSQYCDTENNMNQNNKCFNKKMSLKKIGFIKKGEFNAYSKMKRALQSNNNGGGGWKMIPKNKHNINGIEHSKKINNVNYLSAAKISNRNKCFLCRLSLNEGNSYRHRSKPDNNLRSKEKNSLLNNNEFQKQQQHQQQQPQQRNRTRSSYQKSNAYESNKTIPKNIHIHNNKHINKDKEKLFMKTSHIPRSKRDNILIKDNRSTSHEQSKNKRKESKTQCSGGDKNKLNSKNELSSTSNNNNNTNVSKEKDMYYSNNNKLNLHPNGIIGKRQIITKLTKNKY